MKKDGRKDPRSGALPGQQQRPEDRDVYKEESGESKYGFTADEGVRLASFEKQPELSPDLAQLPCIGQEENIPAQVSRPIESDQNRGFESTLRDPPRGVKVRTARCRFQMQ